jgi:hypothetical protein
MLFKFELESVEFFWTSVDSTWSPGGVLLESTGVQVESIWSYGVQVESTGVQVELWSPGGLYGAG